MPPAKKAKTVAAGQPLIAAAFARRASGDGGAGGGGGNPQASPPGGGAAPPPSFSAAALVRCREAVLEYTDYTVNNIRNDAGTRASERADEADTAENGAPGPLLSAFARVCLRVLHACLRAPARCAAVITRAPAAAGARWRARVPQRDRQGPAATQTQRSADADARTLRSVLCPPPPPRAHRGSLRGGAARHDARAPGPSAPAVRAPLTHAHKKTR
jgi:hypothetical protein